MIETGSIHGGRSVKFHSCPPPACRFVRVMSPSRVMKTELPLTVLSFWSESASEMLFTLRVYEPFRGWRR